MSIQDIVEEKKASNHNLTRLEWLGKEKKAMVLESTVQGWEGLGTKRSGEVGLLAG